MGAGLRNRIAREEAGMTLVELLVVLIIIGVLLAIAVPSYLGYEQRASVGTAKANLRAVLPAVEAYYQDHATYDAASMTPAALRNYDQGIPAGISIVSGSSDIYCIKSTYGNTSFFKNGPAARITATACT
jgi:type IV pilus assembly protein PilA